MYSGVKDLWPRGGYRLACVLLPDAPEKGVAVMGLGGGGGVVVTILTSEALVFAAPLGPALLLRLKVLLGCSLSRSNSPCFITSSICTPISCKSEKVGKVITIILYINFGWRLRTIIRIWSLSVGLRVIIDASIGLQSQRKYPCALA